VLCQALDGIPLLDGDHHPVGRQDRQRLARQDQVAVRQAVGPDDGARLQPEELGDRPEGVARPDDVGQHLVARRHRSARDHQQPVRHQVGVVLHVVRLVAGDVLHLDAIARGDALQRVAVVHDVEHAIDRRDTDLRPLRQRLGRVRQAVGPEDRADVKAGLLGHVLRRLPLGHDHGLDLQLVGCHGTGELGDVAVQHARGEGCERRGAQPGAGVSHRGTGRDGVRTDVAERVDTARLDDRPVGTPVAAPRHNGDDNRQQQRVHQHPRAGRPKHHAARPRRGLRLWPRRGRRRPNRAVLDDFRRGPGPPGSTCLNPAEVRLQLRVQRVVTVVRKGEMAGGRTMHPTVDRGSPRGRCGVGAWCRWWRRVPIRPPAEPWFGHRRTVHPRRGTIFPSHGAHYTRGRVYRQECA